MKFWGWMHHTFRENSKEPAKDAITGGSYSPLSSHTSLDIQDSTACAIPIYNTGFQKQLSLFRESTFEDERKSDFFHGFLSIGTLGTETIPDEPATPTFGISSGDLATENELKLISNELEKFLEVEAKEGHNQPSGRNSDTNTITSTIEAIEGQDAKEDNQPMKFPLQEYLSGSLHEDPETKFAGKKERVSLGELFQVTAMQGEHSEYKHEKKKKQASSTHKSAKNLVKKVLKKLYPSSSRVPASGKTQVASTKKKFQKMAYVFNKKIHPEESITRSEICSSMTDSKDIKPYSIGIIPAKAKSSCQETSKRWIQYELSSHSARNREHWIKTDQDYFVLEL